VIAVVTRAMVSRTTHMAISENLVEEGCVSLPILL